MRHLSYVNKLVGYFGGTLCGWVTFACRDIPSDWCWRVPVLIQIVLPFVALPGFLLAPESPRWLISVGRVEEATAILAEHHAGGDRNDSLVTYQVVEIQATINAEKEASSSASYADMIKTPGNRHRLFISVSLGIFAQWGKKSPPILLSFPNMPQTPVKRATWTI